MQIQTIPGAWSKLTTVTTEPKADGTQYCGIAIGPNSDEGLVSVNGNLLQAGRVLPLRATQYALTNVRNVSKTGTTPIDSIATLQVMLFESAAELGAMLDRPNATYSSGQLALPNAEGTAQLSVPFVGRKQCLFQIVFEGGGGDTFSYEVKGHRWSNSFGSIVSTSLKTAAGLSGGSGVATAFYIGGLGDEAEVWDALSISLWASVASDPAWVDAITVGELA